MSGWLTALGSPLTYASRELLLQLAPESQVFLSGRFAQLLASGLTTPRQLGIAALDGALHRLGVSRMTPLHPGIALPGAAGAISAARQAMAATYRIRLAPEAPEVADALRELAGLAGFVQQVSPNPLRLTQNVPGDPEFPKQWGLAEIHCDTAWNLQTGDPSVVVAVLDTGVDPQHPDLAPALLPGKNFVNLNDDSAPDGWRWEGTLQPGPGAADEVGHGTHVAGIIAAQIGNGLGIAGIAPACRLLPVRVLARLVRLEGGAVIGAGTAADVAAGIAWAVDQGAAVINLSLGFPEVTFAEREAIDHALAHRCIPVAAIGNEWPDGAIMFPAALPGVLAIGAVDRNRARARFSQTARHLALAAPGVDILSTVPGGGYTTQSGTSMATAFVSGVVALLRSSNPALTPRQARTILCQTATLALAQDAPDDETGAGVLDAAAALQALAPL
jgi:subtilisin family serine protease